MQASGTRTCAAPASLPTIITIWLTTRRPPSTRVFAVLSTRQERLPAGAVLIPSPIAVGELETMAKERICGPIRRTRDPPPTEPYTRVPIYGKIHLTTDVLLKEEKRQYVLTDTKVPRRFRGEVATRRALPTTGPRCAGNRNGRPARTPQPKTRESTLLARLPPVKTRTGATALRYKWSFTTDTWN